MSAWARNSEEQRILSLRYIFFIFKALHLKVFEHCFNGISHSITRIVLLIVSFIVLRFKHEPLARAIEQPCLTYDNKLDWLMAVRSGIPKVSWLTGVLIVGVLVDEWFVTNCLMSVIWHGSRSSSTTSSMFDSNWKKKRKNKISTAVICYLYSKPVTDIKSVSQMNWEFISV